MLARVGATAVLNQYALNALERTLEAVCPPNPADPSAYRIVNVIYRGVALTAAPTG